MYHKNAIENCLEVEKTLQKNLLHHKNAVENCLEVKNTTEKTT